MWRVAGLRRIAVRAFGARKSGGKREPFEVHASAAVPRHRRFPRRTAVAAVAAGDKKLAEESLKAAQPVIDRMASKGLIHKNKASRHKSRLIASVKKLTQGTTAATKTSRGKAAKAASE